MDIFNKKAKESEQTTNKLDEAFRSLSPSALTAVAGVTALIGTVKSLISVGSNIINISSQFEQTQKSLETVLQSAEKGKELFEDLRKFSFDTTFGVDELASASSQLLNAGEAVGKLQGDLKMLGDLAQGDKNKFAELTSIFAKIQNTGRATSVQLQQLALRGIPIQKTLKEMGVTGVASAEQLTQAFEKLTGEGGQFHNAMNNIIDTIEGKRGFITDTLKEINVNFGQLTGITDTYKEALDFVYEILNSVNNKLIEWNDNPMMKAVMSGLLASSLTTLAVIIGVSLVGALNTVIVKLGIITALKTALTGATGIFGLAVAGIAGLVGGIASYSRSIQKAEKDMDALNEKIKENIRLSQQGSNPVSESRNSRLEQAEKDLKTYTDAKSKVTENYNNAKKAYEDYVKMTAGLEETYMPDLGIYVKVADRTAELKDEVDRWSNSINSANTLIDQTNTKITKIKKEISDFGDKDALETVFNSVYEIVGKSEAEMENLKTQLQQIQLYKDMEGKYDNAGQLIKFDDKTRQAIDDSIRYLENKIKGVSAWEDVFRDVTGISVPKVGTKDKSKGQLAGEDYIARMNKLYEAQVNAEQTIGTKNASSKVAEEMVKTIENQLKNLISNIDVDQPFEETDATIKAMVASMENFKTMIDDTTEVIERSFTSLSDVADYLMNLATGKDENGNFLNSKSDRIGAMAGAMAINGAQGSNAGDIANGAMQGASVGGPIGALIGILVALAMKTQTFMDALEDLNGIIDPLLKAVNAILKPITSLAKVIINVLSPILEALATVIEKVFDFFFGWLNDYADSTREANEEKRKEIERLRAVTDAYSNMLTTLRAVEEEYERRRKQINAQTYNESVTGVHDMILTPQGKFSTDPDDYIIATKNPSNLNNRGGVPNVIVNNYTNDTVETRIDDNGNIILLISQKVALDYAQGNNGWDNAVMARQARMAGRNLAM